MLRYLINEKGLDAKIILKHRTLLHNYISYRDPLIPGVPKPKVGDTGNSFSLVNDDLEFIRTLIKAGVDINAENVSGKTALDVSLESYRIKDPLFNFKPRHALLKSLGAKKGSGIKKQ